MTSIPDRLSALITELIASGRTLATAESCTAGRLASTIADEPGAGECFLGGFVVYAKVQKIRVLGIDPSLIASQSAVSQPVAEAMATGIFSACEADVGVSVTGVLGPAADGDGNPVGLVYVAAATRGGQLRCRRLMSHGEQTDVLTHAISAAIDLVADLVVIKEDVLTSAD